MRSNHGIVMSEFELLIADCFLGKCDGKSSFLLLLLQNEKKRAGSDPRAFPMPLIADAISVLRP